MMDNRLWSCCPKQSLDWEVDGSGRAVVLRPKFGSGKWGRRLALWLGASCYRIRLDEVGTVVWTSCDGQTPVSQVLERLRHSFGDRIEPAEDRLQRFVDQLIRSRMIEF